MTLAIPIGLCLVLLWCSLLTWNAWHVRRWRLYQSQDHTRLSRAVHRIAKKLWGNETEEMQIEPAKTQVWTHDEQWRLRKETGPRDRR